MKKCKIMITITVVSIIAIMLFGCGDGGTMPSMPNNGETSDYYQLDVPYIEQNSGNTCLPASAAMVLKYYEDPRDIAEIRDKLALPWQEDGTGGIMVSGHGRVEKLFDYVKTLGFEAEKEWDGLTIEEIKDKLEDEFPIIVLQDFNLDETKTEDGHFSVVVGYREVGDSDEENKLIINDPWSTRGQYWEVTYSDYKIRNSNWWKEQHDRDSDLSHAYIIWKDTSITNTYTITASAGSNGSISPSGDVSVNEGSDQSFTITPDTGYQIDDVLVDGSSVGAVSSYAFTNVTEDHVISAGFISLPNDVVQFEDPNLEQAIRETINKPGGPLYLNDVIGITELYAYNREIKSLEGIQHLQNLEGLYFYDNQVTNISALSSLINLHQLWFSGNQVSNISALSSLINLQFLDFSDNNVSNISALSSLINLERLGFSGNQVSNISALSSLINLYELWFSENNLSDISPLKNLTNLQVLQFYDNQVTDISTLSSLINLQDLEIGGNQVSNILALSKLTNLWWLEFTENQVTDISALSNLTNLQELYFGYNNVSNISALSNLTNLQFLDLDYNQVTDISALVENEGLGHGDYISMKNNYLDLGEGSRDMQDIETLINRGVDVHY